jgi:chromosome segregation ATPase
MKYLGFLLLTFCLAIFSEESSTNKKIDNIDLRLSGLEDEHRNFKKEVDEILTVVSSSLDDLEEDFGEIDDFVNSNETVKEINEDVLNNISSNIQVLDTEVRKLWDLSNKRNKVKINNLEKTIKDLTILIQQLEVKISKLEDSSG